MPQLLLQGFPDGAIEIGPILSILQKDGRVTYFVGEDNYFSHRVRDQAGQRFAIATLIDNGHVRACDVERSELGIPYRTLMNWSRQLSVHGADSFFKPRTARGDTVMTDEKVAACERLLNDGATLAAAARSAKVADSTLRKAVASGRVVRSALVEGNLSEFKATTKSERSRADAHAAEGMGTACTRADERMATAVGLVQSANARHEHCVDVPMGGVLAGLPALCANGLFSGLDRHLSLSKGFYSAMHILTLLGFMALARIRRPENLRGLPPGELGKVIGLDRAPEVRTLRAKVVNLVEQGSPEAWMKDLSRQWMAAEPDEAGYLYVDGHVRVYHGTKALLPRRFVSREKLCLRGTTDYWVNDALGRPFFVVSETVPEGLAAALLDQILPELLTHVPLQPSQSELEADPLLHRFVVVFDREGSSHSLLSKLWEHRVGAITYRKAVKDEWPIDEFFECEVLVPCSGNLTRMLLASRQTELTAGQSSIPVLEVRRLSDSGHQTAIITTAQRLATPQMAGRMFARWCQENFFAYMMEHFDMDRLVQYGSEEIPGTTLIVNPAWRTINKAVTQLHRRIRKLSAEYGEQALRNDAADIQKKADLIADIKSLKADRDELRTKRRQTTRKVRIDSLPEEERPSQLRPLAKMFTDTVKMIAYRAETALVGLLRPHLSKEAEARALIRELFVSSADLEPNQTENTLTVHIHRMACPAHDKAIDALLGELNELEFCHPETGMRMIYKLA